MASGDINKWQSTSSTVFDLATNWSLGTALVDGEHAVIPPGKASILQNVDQTNLGANGLELGSFTVEAGYENTIGDSGAPMMWTAGEVLLLGAGPVYIQAARDAGTANIDSIIIAQTGGMVVISDEGIDALVSRIAILAGQNVTLAAGMLAIDMLEILQHPSLPAPVVTIGTGTAIAQAYVSAGTITGHRAITVYSQDGGTFTHDTGAFSDTIISGGTLKYMSSTTMAGRTLIKSGGTLDVQDMSHKLTITALHQQPSGTLLRPRKKGLLTITTEYDYGQAVVN